MDKPWYLEEYSEHVGRVIRDEFDAATRSVLEAEKELEKCRLHLKVADWLYNFYILKEDFMKIYNWSKEDYKRLKKAYEEARLAKKELFTFEIQGDEVELLQGYAKYLIEHLSNTFDKKKKSWYDDL